eukprot:712659-Prorocentrum_minimum.AAC.1
MNPPRLAMNPPRLAMNPPPCLTSAVGVEALWASSLDRTTPPGGESTLPDGESTLPDGESALPD